MASKHWYKIKTLGMVLLGGCFVYGKQSPPPMDIRNTRGITKSPNCSRNSDVLKTPNVITIRLKILRCLSVFVACRSVPLMAILYYIFGAAAFGLARGKTSLDIALFPLEFTTSGGLEHVSSHVRILYGCYVEGAMLLLSCGLAALRRHSSAAFKCMTDKYRLYDSK